MRHDYHVNPTVIQILENSKDIRRLKHHKPYDLVQEFRLRSRVTSLEVRIHYRV